MAADPELKLRLSTARVARLATVRPDGSPHLVPCCFAVEGDRLYSAVDAKPKRGPALARFANVAHEPRVALMADEWSEDWSRLWWVRVDGRAHALAAGSDAERRALDLLAGKYEQYRSARPGGPVLVIEVDRWSGWSAS